VVLMFKERLQATGEAARLRALLLSRLTECGWRQSVTDAVHGIIRQQGLDNTTLDSLIQQTTPMARDTVPLHVKHEMLEQIRKSLARVQRQQQQQQQQQQHQQQQQQQQQQQLL